MRNLMIDAATECMMDVRDELRGAPQIAFSGDKGEKKHVDHFAKAVAWWSRNTGRVSYFVLDIDGTGGKSSQHAQAVLTSVKKLAMPVKLIAFCSDSCGGGTLESFAGNMNDVGILFRLVFCCELHASRIPESASQFCRHVVWPGQSRRKERDATSFCGFLSVRSF
jgi:hypothetical protein